MQIQFYANSYYTNYGNQLIQPVLALVQKLLLKFETKMTKTRMRSAEIRGRMDWTEKAK